MRRTLDWWALCQIADRRNPADRAINLAGVPARVRPSRGTDVGFYVQHDSDDPEAGWELRTRRELVLLAMLVEAGAVTIDEPDTSPLRQEPRT